MKKLLIMALFLVIGFTLWATEGEWTYSECGTSFFVEYNSGEQLWRSFRRYTEGCSPIGETQIPIRFGYGEYRMEVRMTNQITVINLIEDGYYSWFVIYKQ